jgi:hypothetical protein
MGIDVDGRSIFRRPRASEQPNCYSVGAKQLSGHHTIGVPGPTEDAGETRRDRWRIKAAAVNRK